jgi:molecular chaperone DnaK
MDQEFPVGGCVTAGTNQSLAGFTLVFVNETLGSTWRSGGVTVAADGRFMTKLWAEKGKPNTFRVELRDASSNKCQIEPDHLGYSFGLVPDNPILIHSIGIALANNEMRVFYDKGTPLPTRNKRFDQKLAHRISRSAADEAIRIPVVEGEHKRADRNWLIGYLEIPATNLTRDLPAGAQIELTIKIDQSRQVKVEAHITMLNVEYDAKLSLEREVPGPAQLREDVENEKKRLEEVRAKARIFASTDPITSKLLDRIEGEQVVEKIESNLSAAQADQDAADKCQNQLLSLKAMLDDLEETTAVPRMLAEAQEMIDWTFEAVKRLGRGPDQLKYEQYERELRTAMESRSFNRAELARKIDQMDSLRIQILMARNEWWLEFFVALEEQREMMTDQSLAEKIFGQARRATENNNFQGLRDACKQLVQLLPVRQQETVGRFRSNVM